MKMDKILKELVELVESKQGIDITVIDIRDVSSISDHIMIITANSMVHSRSMSKYIVDFLKDNGLTGEMKNKNLDLNNPWVLIDGGEIIINLFLKETREFYNLEKLFFKGKVVYGSPVMMEK
jgi:ribosome-associated protein